MKTGIIHSRYPERLKEYREVLADGVEDIWYELCAGRL